VIIISNTNQQPQPQQKADARLVNIQVAKAIANNLKTTLGPYGMDKMLVTRDNDLTISNDGATILKNMEMAAPAGKLIVDVAKTQEQEIGDGTTSVVILTGKLLQEAEILLVKKVHPISIIKGYKLAENKAKDEFDNISLQITKDKLKDIIKTTMTGKLTEYNSNLIDLIYEAVTRIDETSLDLDNIKVMTCQGKPEESSLHDLVLDKEFMKETKKLPFPKILLIDDDLDIKETEAEVHISDPVKYQEHLVQEEKRREDIAKKLIDSKADVIICQKGIETSIIAPKLHKLGIACIRRTIKDDMEKLAKLSGAKIISNINDITESCVGQLESMEEVKINNNKRIIVKGNNKISTLLIRGNTEHITKEMERAVEDSLGALKTVLKTGNYLYGAGSCELQVSEKLREYAKEIQGKEQLAIMAYANALEVIPETLIESSGKDPLDLMAELKAKQKQGIMAGVDVINGKVVDMLNSDVIEPTEMKLNTISSATELSVMILRTDDFILSSGEEQPPL